MVLLLILCFTWLPPIDVPDDDVRMSELVQQFETGDRDQRIDAILAIGKRLEGLQDELHLEQAFGVLIDATVDNSDLVNSAGRTKLAQHKERAIAYLKPYIESDDFRQYAKACEAIKAIGPPARVYLKQLEQHVVSETRNFQLAALHGLGALDGKDVLPLLDKVIAALDSEDFNIQLSACRVISRIGPPAIKSGPKLVELLENGVASSRSWASIALGAIGPHEDYDVVELLSERLNRFYLIDRERALIGLAHLGKLAEETLPRVEELMKDPTKSVQHVAARTHWKISGDPEQAVECLISLVPRFELAVDSMDILGEIGPPAKAAVPVLVKQLASPEAPTREAAVYALASIGRGAVAAIKPLKRVEKKDPDQLIRSAAGDAIKQIDTPVEQPVDETEADSNSGK